MRAPCLPLKNPEFWANHDSRHPALMGSQQVSFAKGTTGFSGTLHGLPFISLAYIQVLQSLPGLLLHVCTSERGKEAARPSASALKATHVLPTVLPRSLKDRP